MSLRKLPLLAGILAFSLIGYVLSVGPAFYVCRASMLAQQATYATFDEWQATEGRKWDAVSKFYRPLWLLSNRSPSFGQAIDWYMNVWDVQTFD